MDRPASLLIFLLFAIPDCAHGSFDISKHLNTKTPYPERDAGDSILPSAGNDELIHLEYVARHGSREPTNGDVSKLGQLEQLLQEPDVHAQLEAHAPADVWTFIRDWVSPFSKQNAGLLTTVGEEEHYNISKRFGDSSTETGKLFAQQYFPWRFPIRTTQVYRAARSGNAFGFGLLGQGRGVLGGADKFNAFFTFSASANEDNELRFFKTCKKYQALLTDRKDALAAEQSLFLAENGEAMASSVAKQLGLDRAKNASLGSWLDYKVAQDMWKACAFEASIHGDTSKFCTLFTENNTLDFEWADDLETYYTKGWGTKLAYEISCPLLKNIVEGIENAWSGTSPTPAAASMRFAHAETILPFTALLGLYEDSAPLKASWTRQQRADRKWKTSVISPFAANYAFYLYNNSGKAEVALRHNEEPLAWPTSLGCASKFRCELATLKLGFATALSCPFDEMCGNDTPGPSPPPAPSSDSSEGKSSGISVVVLIVSILFSLALGAGGAAVGLRVCLKKRDSGASRYAPLLTSDDDDSVM